MMTKCLVEKCTRPAAATARGLCLVCYSQAKKLVASDVTTWDKLEGMRLVTPKDGTDLFMEAYNRGMDAARDSV